MHFGRGGQENSVKTGNMPARKTSSQQRLMKERIPLVLDTE